MGRGFWKELAATGREQRFFRSSGPRLLRKHMPEIPLALTVPTAAPGCPWQCFSLQPWPPLFPGEADTDPLGAHTIPDPLSSCQGSMNVLHPPLQVPLIFLVGVAVTPLAPARSSQRLEKPPDGASFYPSALRLFHGGGGGHSPGPNRIAQVAIGMACPCPSHPPRPRFFQVGMVVTPVANKHVR